MTFTSHGHHIPFTTLGNERPQSVARCGGPRLCKQCTTEAALYVPALKDAATPQYHRRGGDMDFLARARELVYEYAKPKMEITDTHVDFTPGMVYVVWFSKTLQNWKALVSTTLPDGMYYEVTYNGDKREAYIDAYKKFDNVAVADAPEEPHPLSA